MTRRPRRHPVEQVLGRILFGDRDRPLSYQPPAGVRYRIRCLAEVERLYRLGLITSDDLLRARRCPDAL